MGDYRRHANHTRVRLPREKRTLKLYGEGEHEGKWYRCWNCGFRNNIDVAQRADTFTGGDNSEVYETTISTPSSWGTAEDGATALTIDSFAPMGCGPLSMNLMRVDSSGSVVAPYVSRSPNITGGCAFCGCLNYY